MSNARHVPRQESGHRAVGVFHDAAFVIENLESSHLKSCVLLSMHGAMQVLGNNRVDGLIDVHEVAALLRAPMPEAAWQVTSARLV